MKKMTKVVFVLAMILASLGLTGCDKYTSSWSASLYVHSNTSSNAYMDFWTFKGTVAHTMKCKNESGVLSYSAKLEKGNAVIYVDYDGTKKELFKINGGEEVNSSLNTLKQGPVYVIVETDGVCENGKFYFDIKD
ncbi:MAG: hypothetical protein IKP88_18595 [Lachnospiraceae bacterium]|nr:hypothetical protein [Lachnospiraceae bacterium]